MSDLHNSTEDHQIDLDAYLTRINYNGPSDHAPTLQTLKSLQLAHACSIPFENLDVLLGRGIDVGIQAIEQKLITSHRGGYCFEHNSLMLHVLRSLGYDAIGLSGRVIFSSPPGVMPARTHLFVRVMLERIPWLVDVGVGGFTPTQPLRMDISEPQETIHDTRRIIKSDEPTPDGFDHWFHQILINDEWKSVYEFTGEQMLPIDRELGNWWTSASPQSTFRDKIMVARAAEDGSRHTLATRKYAHRHQGEPIKEIDIQSTDQLLEIMDQHFGLRFPAGTKFGIDGL
ncbi:MAG: arylamine N-acetyltransferase [Phycisphaerales bacterium]|nr:arylamine N-acetyltransferase [Phycisphaerales bacterium]